MKYNWIDYTIEYATLVEQWMDEDAQKYTGCDEGWENYINYWKNDSGTQWGVNFWCKLICEKSIPFAVIAIGFYDNRVTISEFIVAPEYRGKGYGTTALRELLSYGIEIIGLKIESAVAVIFPNNISSQNVFEKAGFIFEAAHPDGDAWYYTYQSS